jgi:hypothetical protein
VGVFLLRPPCEAVLNRTSVAISLSLIHRSPRDAKLSISKIRAAATIFDLREQIDQVFFKTGRTTGISAFTNPPPTALAPAFFQNGLGRSRLL